MPHQTPLHYRLRKIENKTIKCPHVHSDGTPCTYETHYGKANLMSHIRQNHTDIRPFKCPECDKTYNQKFNRDKHRNIIHGAPLPPTSATRHAMRTSVAPIFSMHWILQITTDAPFKHREFFERYEGIYDSKQSHLPNPIQSNMSRYRQINHIDYGWAVSHRSILPQKKRHSKKITQMITKFMNEINAIRVLHPHKIKPHLLDLYKDYPKSTLALTKAMTMYAHFAKNN